MLWPVPNSSRAARCTRAFARYLMSATLGAMTLGSGVAGCKVVDHPTEPHVPPPATATPTSWDEVLAAPVDVDVHAVVSARWEAARGGLINLKHPEAKKAELRDGPVPIVLLVGIVEHPTAGDFIVDTGIDTALANREPDGAVRGALARQGKNMEALEPLANIIERLSLELSGVLLTHSHIDHILGLPDVPEDVPVYIGPGELDDRRKLNALLRPTVGRLFEGLPPARELDPATALKLAPFDAAVDLLGDGSIWGLLLEGHTKGSVAWLVNATDGPVLFVGDTSHTRWGWDNGVEPGKYTGNQELNATALEQLRTFVRQHPNTRVYVGHEL